MQSQSFSQRSQKRIVSCKNACSRTCNVLFMTVFFLVLVVALTSLGIFTKKDQDIKRNLHKSGYDCILFATKHQLGKGHYSDNSSCGFAIWGNAIVALGAGLLLLAYLIKAAVGTSILSVLTVLDLIAVFILFLVSLSVSMDIGIGLAITCDNYHEVSQKKNCEDNPAYGNSTKKVHFYKTIFSSEILSWAITVTLFVLTGLYIILTISYCIQRRQRYPRSRVESSETLLSSVAKKGSAKSAATSTSYDAVEKSTNPFE